MECQKYVIHLEERTDRYELMKEDLFVQYPECNIFNALKDPDDGCRALSKGFRNLFNEALRTGEDMILTFEDDVKFTSPNSRKRFEEVYAGTKNLHGYYLIKDGLGIFGAGGATDIGPFETEEKEISYLL